MKNILFVITMLIIVAKISLGQDIKLTAGLAFPTNTFYWDEYGETDRFMLKHGFKIGPTYKIEINELSHLKTGALLNLKGYNSLRLSELGWSNEKNNFWYIDVPIVYVRNFKIGNQLFFWELGPYAGIGLSAIHKLEYSYELRIIKENINSMGTKKDDFIRRMDYGLLLGVGIDLKELELGLSFSYGIRDISRAEYANMKNVVAAVYFSYFLFDF